MSQHDSITLSVAEAREIIQQSLTPVTEQEPVELGAALHRTLACDVLSPMNVPPHDYSAMDGYALRCADPAKFPENFKEKFKLIGNSFAGHPFEGTVSAGECVRIMTGSLIPEGCDSVAAQEYVVSDGDTITIPDDVRRGLNIRRAGEDIQQGMIVLAQGQLIRPVEMGLLASLGISQIAVYRKLRVAIFSTGDELRQPGSQLAAGQIYDSNRYTLLGLLNELGAEVLDQGSIHDNKASLRTALADAAQHADVIITSGGVSVGEADYVKPLLAEIGEVLFWKIAMKPGKPLAFGKIAACYFFGLPGNPVAVMVTFQQLVRDALLILMGQQPKPAFTFKAVCTCAIKKEPGRAEFQRGILSQDKNNGWVVRTTGNQGSGILSSMSQANCFIVLPASQGNSEAGKVVEVQLLPDSG